MRTRAKLEPLPDGSAKFYSDQGIRAGWWYRVYDCTTKPRKRVPLASPAASVRVFVMAHGDQWVYAFAAGEDRSLRIDLFERQLATGTYSLGKRERAGGAR